MNRIKSSVGILAVVFAFAVAVEARQKKNPPPPPPPAAEYASAANPNARNFSEFVKVGNMIYLAGKLGIDHLEIGTGRPYLAALVRFFEQRRKRMRR